MNKSKMFFYFLITLNALTICAQNTNIVYPAQNSELWYSVFKDKCVAYAGIFSSITPDGHSLDLLLRKGINITKIFAPEHGFSGTADAGAKVDDSVDTKTGIPIISLYGKVRVPTKEHLADVDVIVFDMVDMGCRFNTKLITMQAMMEAAAAHDVEFVVFDRPNPNGHYVDGNILDTNYRSGVGKQTVPIVHGMTPGEYALMLNGEAWLKDGVKCKLTVIPCSGYSHKYRYYLPMFSAPNLRSDKAINLYPSTCFFEGTALSEGRGTDRPFEIFGSPLLPELGYSFTPEAQQGAMKSKHYGVQCYGMDLGATADINFVDLQWVIWAYKNYPEQEKKNFFTPFFTLLSAGPTLQKQIESGMSAEQIRESWAAGLAWFKDIRSKYLLYEDFKH